MDLFVLLINKGVGVYCIGLAFGIFSSVRSVPAQMFPGLFFLSIMAWVFTLYRSRLWDFLFCTKSSCTIVPWFVLLINQGVGVYCMGSPSSYKRGLLFCTTRSCTNVPWFVLLINQGKGVYSIQVSPYSYKRGIFSSVRHGPAHMFPGLFCLSIRAWAFTLYRSRLTPTSEGFSLLTKRSSTNEERKKERKREREKKKKERKKEKVFIGSRSNNQNVQVAKGTDWRGRLWKDLI